MEDEEVVFHDLGLSDCVPLTFLAVYDGYVLESSFSTFAQAWGS